MERVVWVTVSFKFDVTNIKPLGWRDNKLIHHSTAVWGEDRKLLEKWDGLWNIGQQWLWNRGS